MFSVIRRLPIKHYYRRPPPWPSQIPATNYFPAAKKYTHAIILLLFSHLCLLFRLSSYLCLDIMNKIISRCIIRHTVVGFSFLNMESPKLTVIPQFKKQTVHIPSRSFTGYTLTSLKFKKQNVHIKSRLFTGYTLSSLKSSMFLLFIAINILSTSDLSSSDGRKSHFVASAISSASGVRANGVATLRCYICGGQTGLPCEDIRSSGRRSPYVQPKPQTTLDGRKMFENCTDLINNKGCIKQVINGGK